MLLYRYNSCLLWVGGSSEQQGLVSFPVQGNMFLGGRYDQPTANLRRSFAGGTLRRSQTSARGQKSLFHRFVQVTAQESERNARLPDKQHRDRRRQRE